MYFFRLSKEMYFFQGHAWISEYQMFENIKIKKLHWNWLSFAQIIRNYGFKKIKTLHNPSNYRSNFNMLPVHWMIANFIMAELACEQLFTTCGEEFTVPFVVFTAKNLFFWISKRWRASRHIFIIRMLLV